MSVGKLCIRRFNLKSVHYLHIRKLPYLYRTSIRLSGSKAMALGNDKFVETIQDLLHKGKTSQAIELFNDEKSYKYIEDNVWDLTQLISQFVSSNNKKNNNELFSCCLDLLNIVASKFNPREVLLQFLGEIEDCEDDIKFLALLKPLQTTLIRTPRNTWKWCFKDIWKYLKKCDPPCDENLTGKEKLLFDTTEKVQRIAALYKDVLVFYDPFVEHNVASYDLNSHTVVIRTFLIQLLGKPLIYLDMEDFDKIKSKARVIAETTIKKILKTTSDFVPLLEYRFFKNNDNVLQLDAEGLASLIYLVYSEGVAIEQLPVVYNPIYFFQKALFLVTVLLKFDSNIVVEKGLKLAAALFFRVKGYRFSYKMLNSEDHCHFCKMLSKVIVYNQMETIRKSAFEIYKVYLQAFDNKGFYLLISNLMTTINHTGLIAFTITAYKDRMVCEFTHGENISKYFRGDRLLQLLKKFCYLHENEESDMIELYEQITASLNLLRYLAIRDKSNVTEIWHYFNYIQKNYFEYLRTGIELSRAHYKLEIKEIEEKKKMKNVGNVVTAMDVTVGGRNLAQMSVDEKQEVLNSFLTAFDMMDSLLSRVVECIEMNRPIQI